MLGGMRKSLFLKAFQYYFMNKLFLVITAAFFCAVSANVSAQTQKVVADKIAAQVGDKIILRSDIVNIIADYKRQGQDAQLPPDPECTFLEGQLIQKALVLQAQRDSLPVSDDELDAALDNRIRYFISMYGSKEILEEIAGKTVYQLKEDYRPSIREQMLSEAMRKKIVENIKITPTEVKEYFSKIPADSLQFYESELEISQLVIYPKASKDIDDYVVRELTNMKQQVESGQKKFDALAKLYSDDPGTKENGGQLSLNRSDKMWDPTFQSTVFRLKEGQVSPVIKSKFGFHIIQMISRSGDDAIVRHILKIPPVTDDEITGAKAKLDSVRTKIVDGTIPFNIAVAKFSDDESTKTTGGNVMAQDGSTYVTIDELDKDMVVSLKDLKVGEISKAVAFTLNGKKGARLIYLKSRSEPHRENMKDDYNKIANRAVEEKKNKALRIWFSEHIPTYFISIDKEFNSCSNIAEWKAVAAQRDAN